MSRVHCKECGANVFFDSHREMGWSSIEDFRKYKKIHGIGARVVKPEYEEEK